MAIFEYDPQGYWEFSRKGDRSETSKTAIPEGKEAKLSLLQEAAKNGWAYVDQGYGFEHVSDVITQVKGKQ